MKRRDIRSALLAALRRDVAELVRQDHIDGLLDALSGTGYDNHRGEFTSREIGRAILALAPVIADVEDLACVVHCAAYHRHRGPRDLSLCCRGAGEITARELAEHRAEATLDRAGPGVLGRFLLRMNESQGELDAMPSTPAEAVH